jgi:hypothetical protein
MTPASSRLHLLDPAFRGRDGWREQSRAYPKTGYRALRGDARDDPGHGSHRSRASGCDSGSELERDLRAGPQHPIQYPMFRVPNGTSSIGTTIQLYHCHGYASNGAPQRWRFIPFTTDADGETAYLIENMGNHLCLSYTPGNGDFFFVSQDSCLDSQSNLVHLWVIRRENPSGTDPNFMLDSVTWNASTGVYNNGHCISASKRVGYQPHATGAGRVHIVPGPQEVFNLG